MRVLIAPDSFTGTLSASAAASAIGAGWQAAAPNDQLTLAPVSDGGPGFVDVLATALGGRLLTTTVADPLRRMVRASLLVCARTAYVESAQACGLHLLDPAERDPRRATSYGVGQLIAAALDARAERIVVGLGGSATNDGGAGAIDALGGVEHARRRLGGVALVAATDVDNPLLGPHGATVVYGTQKGLAPTEVERAEESMRRWAAALGAEHADRPGAGAAGGLGFALLVLGARRVAGVDTVLSALGLADRIRQADVVVTGEGSLDSQSLRGKAVTGVAALATAHRRPCLVLAGRVQLDRRRQAAVGITAAYGVSDPGGPGSTGSGSIGSGPTGSGPASSGTPAARLAALATAVAGQWSARWRSPRAAEVCDDESRESARRTGGSTDCTGPEAHKEHA